MVAILSKEFCVRRNMGTEGLSHSLCQQDRVYILLESWMQFEIVPEEESQVVQLFLSKHGQES